MGFFDSLFGRDGGKPRLLISRRADLKMAPAPIPRSERQCTCLLPEHEGGPAAALVFHTEQQDKTCEGWKLLELLVERAAKERAKEFAPGLNMPPALWKQIVTLPESIMELKTVRKLYLYGSNLVRLPVAIGEMENLEEFDAYTSYRLHWLPYEITRCRKLRRSRMSTRALYGNFKYRPSFPSLTTSPLDLPMSLTCSICRAPIPDQEVQPQAVWISLEVGCDVMPLLVNACSEACVQKLPPPAPDYVPHPHKGGTGLVQPLTYSQKLRSAN